MIKKSLKPWYSTKEKENWGELSQKFLDLANRVNYTSMNNYGNWYVVGSDVATMLNSLYTGTTTTNTTYTTIPHFCGTTYTTSVVTSGSTSFMTFSG